MNKCPVEQIHFETDAHPLSQVQWYRRRSLSERIHAIGLWCLILFLSGAVAGIAFAFRYHSSELSKATQLGCLIHNGVTYDLKPRGQK